MPAWGTTATFAYSIDDVLFQSTCPRGARHLFIHCIESFIDFNPRARVGHDSIKDSFPFSSSISIHVPAWGTTYPGIVTTTTTIFQSTCPRGARPLHTAQPAVWQLFQSTCPRGARLGPRHPARLGAISIHVPAWGTTTVNVVSYSLIYFNPRARVGHDVRCSYNKPACVHFNPRARVGHDDNISISHIGPFISIHVPAWGTTFFVFPNTISCRFQSTCPRGARPLNHSPYPFREISIHVPAWGTTCYNITFPILRDFNPRARVGHDSRITG